MRINTGTYKGRKLALPEKIRPTQNKVRKALFDILGDISGLSFLELFAGSGSVGFEALSRGAGSLALVEGNSACLAAIKKNLELLEAQVCSVYPIDAQRAIERFHKEGKVFDIIFLDPPYYQDLAKKTLQTLGAYDILAPYGLVVVQHFKKESLPDSLGALSLLRQYKYSGK